MIFSIFFHLSFSLTSCTRKWLDITFWMNPHSLTECRCLVFQLIIWLLNYFAACSKPPSRDNSHKAPYPRTQHCIHSFPAWRSAFKRDNVEIGRQVCLLRDCLYIWVVRLVATGGGLTRRPKRSFRCLLVKVPWQINEYLNLCDKGWN